MYTYRMLATVTMVGFLLAMCAQAIDADPNMAQQVTVKGKVVVVKDPSGLITSVKIIAQNATYFVILDENGNFLGTRMAGKDVVVVGMLRIKNNERWLTVERFAEQEKW